MTPTPAQYATYMEQLQPVLQATMPTDKQGTNAACWLGLYTTYLLREVHLNEAGAVQRFIDNPVMIADVLQFPKQ